MSDGSDMLDGAVLYAPQAGQAAAAPHRGLVPLSCSMRPDLLNPGVLVENAVRPVLAPVPFLPGYDASDAIRQAGEKRFAEAVRTAGLHDGVQELHIPGNYRYTMIGGPKLDIPNATTGSGFKLLQLNSEEHFGLMFGDMGVTEFWNSETDLAVRRFERAYVDSASC